MRASGPVCDRSPRLAYQGLLYDGMHRVLRNRSSHGRTHLVVQQALQYAGGNGLGNVLTFLAGVAIQVDHSMGTILRTLGRFRLYGTRRSSTARRPAFVHGGSRYKRQSRARTCSASDGRHVKVTAPLLHDLLAHDGQGNRRGVVPVLVEVSSRCSTEAATARLPHFCKRLLEKPRSWSCSSGRGFAY